MTRGGPPEPRLQLAEQLEEVILGGRRRYTRGQVEQLSGVSRVRTERLWRALGFADADDDEVVFTDADLEALRLIDGLVGAGVIDGSVEAAAARSVGQSLSRLAEWEIGMLHEYVVGRQVEGNAHGNEATVMRVAETILPLMDQLHSYVWRRHLASFAGRTSSTSEHEVVTVGFADVVGYTTMSRQISETELAALIERFESLALDVIVIGGGRLVKTLGDEVMFVVDDPVAGAGIALELLERIHQARDLPDLRIGLAWGHVLSRFGDVFGPVVNIASRLTSAAKPGTVLVDRELAAVLDGEERFRLRRRRPMSVSGYSNLSSWRLSRPRPS